METPGVCRTNPEQTAASVRDATPKDHQAERRDDEARDDQALRTDSSGRSGISSATSRAVTTGIRLGCLKVLRRAGSQSWAASIRSRSASQVELPMVVKQRGQMESMVPFLFIRWGNSK